MATSLPASFSNNTSPTGVQLDNNFAAVANMAIWNCTATGTNAIALTVTANQPNVSAYTDRQRFQFVAAATSNGSVTAAVNSLSALPLYLISGTQAASGDVTNGTPYEVIYLSALNSGGGGFQIYSAAPSSAATAQANGLVHGLQMFNNLSTPNTKIDINAGYTVLTTTGGTPKFLASVAVTIDLTTTGANGMDTGARPTSGWVYCYIINNGSTTAGLATATSPTVGLPSPFPGGYSNFAFVGAMYCDSAQNLLRSRQIGRKADYVLVAATNTAVAPNIANGSAGTASVTSPILSAVTVAGNTGVVPLTAGSIVINATNQYKGNTATTVNVAPNTAWGGTNNGPNGSAGNVWSYYSTTGSGFGGQMEFVLEAATIAWASNGVGGAISCPSWTDYYSAG